MFFFQFIAIYQKIAIFNAYILDIRDLEIFLH